jgi:hypothetical protein
MGAAEVVLPYVAGENRRLIGQAFNSLICF